MVFGMPLKMAILVKLGWNSPWWQMERAVLPERVCLPCGGSNHLPRVCWDRSGFLTSLCIVSLHRGSCFWTLGRLLCSVEKQLIGYGRCFDDVKTVITVDVLWHWFLCSSVQVPSSNQAYDGKKPFRMNSVHSADTFFHVFFWFFFF